MRGRRLPDMRPRDAIGRAAACVAAAAGCVWSAGVWIDGDPSMKEMTDD
jgi:hypothetical protein